MVHFHFISILILSLSAAEHTLLKGGGGVYPNLSTGIPCRILTCISFSLENKTHLPIKIVAHQVYTQNCNYYIQETIKIPVHISSNAIFQAKALSGITKYQAIQSFTVVLMVKIKWYYSILC